MISYYIIFVKPFIDFFLKLPKAIARFRGTHPTQSVEIGSGSFTSPKAMARFTSARTGFLFF